MTKGEQIPYWSDFQNLITLRYGVDFAFSSCNFKKERKNVSFLYLLFGTIVLGPETYIKFGIKRYIIKRH